MGAHLISLKQDHFELELCLLQLTPVPEIYGIASWAG